MMPMTVYEGLIIMISFSTLIVLVIALSYTFSKKK
ncbi:putative holin-like toxin [Cytobacillus praedii]